MTAYDFFPDWIVKILTNAAWLISGIIYLAIAAIIVIAIIALIKYTRKK